MKCREGYARYFEAAHTGQKGKTKNAGSFKSIDGAIAYWDEVDGRFLCRLCHKTETIHERRTGANSSFESRKCSGVKVGCKPKWTDIQRKWVFEQNAKRCEYKRLSDQWRQYSPAQIGQRFATKFPECEALSSQQVINMVARYKAKAKA